MNQNIVRPPPHTHTHGGQPRLQKNTLYNVRPGRGSWSGTVFKRRIRILEQGKCHNPVTLFHTRIRGHSGLSNQIRARFGWGWTYCLRVYAPISLESNFDGTFWNSCVLDPARTRTIVLQFSIQEYADIPDFLIKSAPDLAEDGPIACAFILRFH